MPLSLFFINIYCHYWTIYWLYWPFENAFSSTKTTCTFDATAVGSCNLVQYAADLPPIYQNFDQVPGVEPKDIAQVGNHQNIKGKLEIKKYSNQTFRTQQKFLFHLNCSLFSPNFLIWNIWVTKNIYNFRFYLVRHYPNIWKFSRNIFTLRHK